MNELSEKEQGYNEGLIWAADWLIGQAESNSNEIKAFASNIADSIRSHKKPWGSKDDSRMIGKNLEELTPDWEQIYLNGGPPCFAVMGDDHRFCNRAERWEGHPSDHKFVSWIDFLYEVMMWGRNMGPHTDNIGEESVFKEFMHTHIFQAGDPEQGWENQCAVIAPDGLRHCGGYREDHPMSNKSTLSDGWCEYANHLISHGNDITALSADMNAHASHTAAIREKAEALVAINSVFVYRDKIVEYICEDDFDFTKILEEIEYEGEKYCDISQDGAFALVDYFLNLMEKVNEWRSEDAGQNYDFLHGKAELEKGNG